MSVVSCCVMGTSQVYVASGGNVTFDDQTWFQCGAPSMFTDTYGGLYGDGAYLVPWPFCVNGGYDNTDVLQSTLQFGCFACDTDTYTVLTGNSTGQRLQHNDVTCLAC